MSQILIVDDESTIRALLRQALEYGGHDVTEASDGLEGLERCRSVRPDLVLTDLVMPELSGFELIALLRREFPSTAIIAISGSSPRELEQARQLGAFYTFSKPFDLWDLMATVDTLCQQENVAAAD